MFILYKALTTIIDSFVIFVTKTDIHLEMTNCNLSKIRDLKHTDL
jgi:hypothetical protein